MSRGSGGRGVAHGRDLSFGILAFNLLALIALLCAALPARAADVSLAWDAVDGASSYTVHWGTAARVYTNQASAGASTSRTVTGLASGVTYYFAVKASDGAGNSSGYSNEVSTTTPVAAPVANFTVSATSGTAPMSVNFTSTSTGAITGHSWAFGDGTTSTTQNPAKVYGAAGTYTVSLTVTGPGGSHTKTNAGYVTVSAPADTTAPSVPGALVATATGTTTINLAWNASSDNVGVTGYRLERCEGVSCASFVQVATPGGTSFSNTGLSGATTYRYRVRAVDAAGNLSGYSSIATATTATPPDTTAPSAPSSLSATPNGTSTVNLSWSASNDNVGVTGYRVERCEGASCASFVQVATPGGTSFSNTGLSGATTYRYRVRAVDAAGNLSGYSPIAAATTGALAPVASFTATPRAGVAPLAVNFTSTSSGSITSYSWSFGDGTTSTTQNPSKSYAIAGDYTVSLTVTGPGGSHTATQTGYIDVTAPPLAMENRGVMMDVSSGSGTSSNRNGIIEPGESVRIVPIWGAVAGGSTDVTATARVSGPAGATYTLNDSVARYGMVNAGDEVDCETATGNCYRLTVSNPAVRPALRWVIQLTETLSTGAVTQRELHVGKSFPDVPATDAMYAYVESLVHHKVTLGNDGKFLPTLPSMRIQTAMFIARAAVGDDGDGSIPAGGSLPSGAYNCVAGGVSRFADVAPTAVGCKQLHYVAARGANVTYGCTASNRACPSNSTTRAAMAVYVAGAMAGGDAKVPATGTFNDSGTVRSYNCATTGGSRFPDVASSAAYCRHVNYLWARGVVDGFGDGTFMPALEVSRGQMAKFVSNGFGLSTD